MNPPAGPASTTGAQAARNRADRTSSANIAAATPVAASNAGGAKEKDTGRDRDRDRDRERERERGSDRDKARKCGQGARAREGERTGERPT